ncbi:hypothetical protein EXS72_01690 [Candidatus Pacearchaeota archaeon]|nr:hypothetical protein [Candidatus Pacearchaeota archaeon]
MAADISAFVYFLPIFAFLIVFAIMFAVLNKFKLIGENLFFQLFFSFIIATIFVTASSARQVVLNVIPWFAVLIVAMLLLLFLVSFIGKADIIGKGFGWVFVILLIIIFFIAGVKVFASTLAPYLPGATNIKDANPTLLSLFKWIYSPRVAGAFLLVLSAVFVSWILTKKNK